MHSDHDLRDYLGHAEVNPRRRLLGELAQYQARRQLPVCTDLAIGVDDADEGVFPCRARFEPLQKTTRLHEPVATPTAVS